MRDTTALPDGEPHLERYFGVKREQALAGGGATCRWQGNRRAPARSTTSSGPTARSSRAPDYVGEPEEVMRLGRYYLMSRRVLADSAGS